MTPDSTLAPVRALFRAVTCAAVPAAATFDEARWDRAEAIVDGVLAHRRTSVRRQVVLFLRLLSLLARLRTGRSLAALPPERVRAIMAALERAPLLLLRRGVWGVRTLAFTACYGQPEVRAEIGYRARAAGWGARAEAGRAWPGRGGGGRAAAETLVCARGGGHGDGAGLGGPATRADVAGDGSARGDDDPPDPPTGPGSDDAPTGHSTRA